jgi:hypothetical protein
VSSAERDKIDKVLEITKEQVERKFGKGSLMRLGDHEIGRAHV